MNMHGIFGTRHWKDNLSCGILILAILVLTITNTECSSSNKSRRSALDNAKSGIEAGYAISELIEKKEFQGTLAKISNSIGPYLGAIGPFVGFILAFLPTGESAELKYMKQMMKNIDNRFDKIDSQFNSVKRLINWNTYKINMVSIEQNILSLEEHFRLFTESTKSTSQFRRQEFIKQYSNNYGESGFKLYQAITKRGVFQEDLGDALMKYTQNSRGECQAFLLGVMKLLLKAVKLEIAYYQMLNPQAAVKQKDTWVHRMGEVSSAYGTIDNTVRNRYNDQSAKELDEYLTKYYKHSNEEFVNGFYKFLTQKYYWRDWIVFAYNPITGSDVHTIGVCGHLKFREKGRNAAMASVDKTHHKINVATTLHTLNSVRQFKTVGHSVRQHNQIFHAEDIYKGLNKANVCATAVIKKNNGLHISPTNGRLAHSTSGKYYDIFMWG